MFHASLSIAPSAKETEHSSKVRELAGECAVILRNDGTLPLMQTGKVALFGNGARHTIKGGTGSGYVNSRYVVNIEEGLKNAGFEITNGSWLDKYDESFETHIKNYLSEIDRISKETGITPAMVMFEHVAGLAPMPEVTDEDVQGADIAIYVLSRDSGEGGDRRAIEGDFYLSEDECEAFDKLIDSFKRVVLVLNTGGIVSLGKYKDSFSGIVMVSQLGNLTGDIVVDVLTGKADPSGRLTDTWAFDYTKYPNQENFSHNNGNTDDEYYDEGVYVGYRYFDSFNVEADYPFGYGLGYTTFYDDVREVTASGLDVTVRCTIDNTGIRAGKEVVQLYVASPHKKLDKPFKELVAFAKSNTLGPDEKEDIEIKFSLKQIASYCDKCESDVLEAGDYVLFAGKNALKVWPVAVLRIGEDIVTRKLKNRFGDSGIKEEFQNPSLAPAIDTDGIPVIDITYTEPAVEISYNGDAPALVDNRKDEHLTFKDVLDGTATAEELAAQLTVEEMASFCVGEYKFDVVNNNASVVGSSSGSVPGAAAETVETLLDSRGVPSLVMADGPAGLRLQPHFKATKDGFKLPGGEVFGMTFNPFPDDFPEDAIDYYQYCTAIPIASALAQSFNMDLISKMGQIVGEEMKEFYVHFWLAPGMNIHRNPLCGRNFEYYSEDPFLTGKCAAAITNGVQSFGGQGTTIKHFCCNNQEVNRMHSNSHVSERTLRNLYLRGFRIAVEESQPYAVMMSYNLLNGIHTANHVGLVRNVLRDEWGFEGVVMTDWYSSIEDPFGDANNVKYPCSTSVDCIRCGNDWQMPGCEKNVTDIIDAVNDGSLPLGDLQFCTANIIKIAKKCFSNEGSI